MDDLLPDPRTKPKKVIERLLQPEVLDQITVWRKAGMQQPTVATRLGVSSGWISEAKRRYPELKEALDGHKRKAKMHQESRAETRRFEAALPTDLKTDAGLARVQLLVERGVSIPAVAALFDMTVAAFEEALLRMPALDRAVRLGAARGEEQAAERLAKILQDPDHKEHSKVAQFVLRNRYKWSPTPEPTKKTKTALPADSDVTPEAIVKLLRPKAEELDVAAKLRVVPT